MKIKRLAAEAINDTRGEKTICIKLETNFGEFTGSAPNGKSRGEYEAKPWKKSLDGDIKAVNNYYIREINLKKFDDLKILEDIFSGRVGANTMIAIEYAFLKALAKSEDKEVWEIINPLAKKAPLSVGNAIGGGAHSSFIGPEFQEFHFIPEANFEKSIEINKEARENCKNILKNIDRGFSGRTNDENAWLTMMDNESVEEVMIDAKENTIDEFGGKIHCGIDVAASQFYEKKEYKYKKEKLSREQQIKKMIKLADRFFYIEDPLEENDFDGFSKIKKKAKGLIVGDDLTATNFDRIAFAKKKNAVNAVIIKPNQNGSLIEVKRIVEFCRENGIKTVFSHRSGETNEDILADLAFGLEADFIKTGICGKGRDEKLKRMAEIEESLMDKI